MDCQALVESTRGVICFEVRGKDHAYASQGTFAAQYSGSLMSSIFSDCLRTLDLTFGDSDSWSSGTVELQQDISHPPGDLLEVLVCTAPTLGNLTLRRCLPLPEIWKVGINDGTLPDYVHLRMLKTVNVRCDSLETILVFSDRIIVDGTVRGFCVDVDALVMNKDWSLFDKYDDALDDVKIKETYDKLLHLVEGWCFADDAQGATVDSLTIETESILDEDRRYLLAFVGHISPPTPLTNHYIDITAPLFPPLSTHVLMSKIQGMLPLDWTDVTTRVDE